MVDSIHNTSKIIFKKYNFKKRLARNQKSKHYANNINNENKLEMEGSSVVTVEQKLILKHLLCLF